jgi:hypothetical protein
VRTVPEHDPKTGEIDPDWTDEPEDDTARIARLDQALAEAAQRGTAALKEAWSQTPTADQHALKAALDRRHKPVATAADDPREQPAMVTDLSGG